MAYKVKAPFPMKDLSGDGKVTKKDVLIGRGVLKPDGSPTKSLKKVVKQLKGASKMHAMQAEMVQDHIDEMKEGSPAKMYESSSPTKKKDACYHKVKARYDVFPSAYASGAIAACRKVGAANWGNKSKKKK